MFLIGLITGMFIGASVGLFMAAMLLSAKNNDQEDMIKRNTDFALSKDQIHSLPPCNPEVFTC